MTLTTRSISPKTLIASLFVLTIFAGCSSAAVAAVAPVTVADIAVGDLETKCGDLVLGAGLASTTPNGTLTQEQQILLAGASSQLPNFDEYLWFSTTSKPFESDAFVAFGRIDEADPNVPFVLASFEPGGSGWVNNFTFCSPRVHGDGLAHANWRLDPDVVTTSPDSSGDSLTVTMQDPFCASDTTSVREFVPLTRYDAESIVVTILATPATSDFTCERNWLPLTIALSEPLGDRFVLDGGLSPIQPAA